jgi:hypothetical protein
MPINDLLLQLIISRVPSRYSSNEIYTVPIPKHGIFSKTDRQNSPYHQKRKNEEILWKKGSLKLEPERPFGRV